VRAQQNSVELDLHKFHKMLN